MWSITATARLLTFAVMFMVEAELLVVFALLEVASGPALLELASVALFEDAGVTIISSPFEDWSDMSEMVRGSQREPGTVIVMVTGSVALAVKLQV